MVLLMAVYMQDKRYGVCEEMWCLPGPSRYNNGQQIRIGQTQTFNNSNVQSSHLIDNSIPLNMTFAHCYTTIWYSDRDVRSLTKDCIEQLLGQNN